MGPSLLVCRRSCACSSSVVSGWWACSDATAGSSTAENHERTLQSPPHETQSNHLRQQSRKVPKRTTVRMDKQVFKKDTVLR